MKLNFLKFAALVSLLFGLITIFAGGAVIFDLFGMREKQGNYVLFIVWTNFICGFLYLISAYGFYHLKKWTSGILFFAFIILIAAFIGLIIWITLGNIYETKTIVAMLFRLLITIALWWPARRIRTR